MAGLLVDGLVDGALDDGADGILGDGLSKAGDALSKELGDGIGANEPLVPINEDPIPSEGGQPEPNAQEPGPNAQEPNANANEPNPNAGQPSANAPGSLASRLRAGATALAKWASVEAAKGAVSCAGFVAMQKAIEALSPSPTKDALLALATADKNAYDELYVVSTDWHKFLADHSVDGPKVFGSVNVAGASLTRFSLLQMQVQAWDEWAAKKLQPALDAANTTKDMASMKALHTALEHYAAMATDIAKNIKGQFSVMVAAGLDDHAADIASVVKDLSAA